MRLADLLGQYASQSTAARSVAASRLAQLQQADAQTRAEARREQGRIAAEAAMQRGQIWQNGMNNLAGVAGAYFQNRENQPVQAMQKELLGEQLKSAKIGNQQAQTKMDQDAAIRDVLQSSPDMDTAIKKLETVSPDAAFGLKKMKAEWDKMDTEAQKAHLDLFNTQADMVGKAVGSILTMPPEQQAPAYSSVRQQLIQQGIPAEQLPEQFDPETAKSMLMGAADAKTLLEKLNPKPVEMSPGSSLVDPTTGKVLGLVDPTTGKVLGTAPAAKPTPSAELQGYYEAKSQEPGLTFKEYQARQKPPATPKEERLVQIMGPTGTPMWVRESDAVGKPAAQAPRAVTGQERQNLAYYNRAQEAVDTLTKPGADGQSLEDKFNSWGKQAGLGYLPNWFQSKEAQAYKQAQMAFTEARLRKESGAQISANEYANDAKTYFAQPGDSPETIAQKKKARDVVLDGLKFAAGKAYNEYYGESPDYLKQGGPTPESSGAPMTAEEYLKKIQ